MSWAELFVELVKIRWHSTLSGLFDYRTHVYPEFHSVLFTFNPFRVVLIVAHVHTPEFHSVLFTFNPFRVVWLSYTCLPRISFGAIYIQPFQGCLIIVHMHTPNFIRCNLHSTLSGLFDYRSHAYPEFHSGLFTFNPFRVVWLSYTCLPRISFGAIYIQPFQGCLIIVHMFTPNFIRGYLHSTLSGLFDYHTHVYPEFHSVLITFNPFRVVWLSYTRLPRISFGANYIQPFQGCLIIAHMHTPNFIGCYLHSTLSGLFWLSLTCIPPNFIRCYLHSTLSGLLNQLLFMVINGITRFTNDM